MQKHSFEIALALLAAVAIAFVLYAARLGMVISADSVIYIDAARNLARDFSYSAYQYGQIAPLTHYPPLYSALLAAFIKLGIPINGGVLVLNALLYAATVVSAAVIVLKLTGDRVVALFAGALILLAPSAFSVHVRLLTDAVPLPLELWVLYGLVVYVRTGSLKALTWSAVACSVAALARYTGIVLAWTGLAAILLLRRAPLLERARQAALFIAISCGPLALWLLSNRIRLGDATNRAMAIHLPGVDSAFELARVVSRWIIAPGPALLPVRTLMALAVLVAVAFGLYRIWNSSEPGGMFARIALVFILLHMALLAWTMIALDILTHPSPRQMLPVYIALVPLGAVLVSYAISRRPRIRPVLAAVAALMLLANGGSVIAQARRLRASGEGFDNADWKAGVISLVNRIAPAHPIYSNAPDAIYFLTGRPARELPAPIHHWTGLPRPEYPAEMRSLERATRDSSAVVIYFDTMERKHMPEITDVARELGIAPRVYSPGLTVVRLNESAIAKPE
jgi:4-amino-4-deoxy-L-arabinose transferase-like glycosyltransferase